MANLAEKMPGRLFRDLMQRPESSEITGYFTYLEKYRAFNFEFDASASAALIKGGANASADYSNGVAVFTFSKGGLMYEASIGGQKFSYESY